MLKRLTRSEGFTLVETLVASVVLIVGLLGTFSFLAAAVTASWLTRAREGAVTLARQTTEDARSIPFAQLSPGTITAQLQAMPGLASSSTTSWQIVRRGITYTLTAKECSVDDPKDGYGVHDATFCADSSAQGTSDPNPVDMKRVTVDVTWNSRGSHDVREVATISSAGQAVALSASNLQLSSPAASNPSAPTITSPSVTQLQFSVTAPAGTTAIVWTVNGGKQSWTSTQSGTTWTSSNWTISSLSDGTYQVGAQAEGANGVIGPAITIPVRLIRNAPSAPKAIAYGFNSNLYEAATGKTATVAELQWQPNSELNVSGYRLYDPSGTLICTTTNSTSNYTCGGNRAWCATPTACIDFSPPATTASNLTYKIAPVYYDANGAVQQGPSTSMTLVGQSQFAFTFAPSTGNTAGNCSGPAGTVLQDMLSAYTPGSDTSKNGKSLTFCSNPFVAGQQLATGGTATAYFASNGACSVSATYSIDGTRNVISTSPLALPNSPTTARTFSFGTGSTLTLNSGDRIVVAFSYSGNCNNTSIHYGGTNTASNLVTPQSALPVPGTPSALSLTTNSDGSATLTWSPPSNGAAASFYRIYRDGHDYTNRYDTLDASTCTSTCTYKDTHRSGSHGYYVTAVGSTTAGANVNESTPTTGVTG